MRYALQVQYIGKNYAGSQIQFENGKEIDTPTIQGELEKAISTLIFGNTENNNRQIKTIFSGRTDKGVNSKGQVVQSLSIILMKFFPKTSPSVIWNKSMIDFMLKNLLKKDFTDMYLLIVNIKTLLMAI